MYDFCREVQDNPIVSSATVSEEDRHVRVELYPSCIPRIANTRNGKKFTQCVGEHSMELVRKENNVRIYVRNSDSVLIRDKEHENIAGEAGRRPL